MTGRYELNSYNQRIPLSGEGNRVIEHPSAAYNPPPPGHEHEVMVIIFLFSDSWGLFK